MVVVNQKIDDDVEFGFEGYLTDYTPDMESEDYVEELAKCFTTKKNKAKKFKSEKEALDYVFDLYGEYFDFDTSLVQDMIDNDTFIIEEI